MTKLATMLSIFVFLFLAASVTVIWIWKENHDLNELLEQRTEELQSAKLEIGRAQTTIGNAQKEIKNLSARIQEEIEKNKQLLQLYAELKGKYEVEKNKVKIITQVIYKDREIPIPANKIFVKLDDDTFEEVTSMQFNYNDFRLTLQGDAVKQELSYKLHQNFRAVFVESSGPGGVINHYAEIYEQDNEGKDVGAIQLTKFTVVKSDNLQNRFSWWNPKLDIELGLGSLLSDLNINPYFGLNISLMSYGKTEDDLSWRFARLGLGYFAFDDKKLLLNFSPVVGNIAKKMPLISNIWTGPTIGTNFNGLVMVGLGISAVF